MPDASAIRREFAVIRQVMARIEALLEEQPSGKLPTGANDNIGLSENPYSNGATALSIDEVRAMCFAASLPCNLMGEVDSKTFCALFGIADWQLKRWIEDGVVEPRKRAGGRKNYFTVEEINKVRSRRAHNGA